MRARDIKVGMSIILTSRYIGDIPGIVLRKPFKLGFSPISRCEVMTCDGFRITTSVRQISRMVRETLL